MEKFLGKLEEEKKGGLLPKLPYGKERSTYTLVLDLDETLVHYAQGFEVEEQMAENPEHPIDMLNVRPFLKEFLGEMSQYFEIVIFTAALKDYADYILDRIDPSGEFI